MDIYSDIEDSTFYAAYQFALCVRWTLEMQASHYAIAAHRLVILAEVNTVSQDWGNLLIKLSLAETLEEVATRVAEEAWLYNEYAFYISFDYIHDSNLSSYIRFFFESLRLPLAKGSSTFSPSPSSSGSGDVTALRCSEPLRYKVGGPSKVSPYSAGWERMEGMLLTA